MLAATVPVATAVTLTVPVDTVEVMYLELGDTAKLGPTTASATAATPTRISPIDANLSFIEPFLSYLAGCLHRWGGQDQEGRVERYGPNA